MARGVWSDTQPSVNIESANDLDRFIHEAEARCKFPVAISVEANGYEAYILVGHQKSFVYLTPVTVGLPDFVTIGGSEGGLVDFWLQTNHHTQFEARHLISKESAQKVFHEFVQTGQLSQDVEWEEC